MKEPAGTIAAGKSPASVFHGRRSFIAITLLFIPLVLGYLKYAGSKPAPRGGDMIGETSSWKIEFESSGGFSGKGNGGVVVSSGGKVSASSPARRGCEGELLAEEKESIEKIISQANPRSWRKSYARPGNPHGSADQFMYAIKITVTGADGAHTYETSWYDETQDILPSDLGSLVKALWKIRDRVVAKC